MVPRVLRAGVAWAEGAQAVANLLGRVAVFRRWPEPDPGIAAADAPRPPAVPHPQVAAISSGSGGPAASSSGGFLPGYRSHLCIALSRKTARCACFQVAKGGLLEAFRNSQCPGAEPVERIPPFLRDAIRRLGVVAASNAGLESCKLLADKVGGNRALLRCQAKVPGGGRGLPDPEVQRPSSDLGALGAVILPRAA